jgi:hypothetical protein
MTAAAPSSNRPRVVDVAFWFFVGGAVMIMVGGLMASTASFDDARAYLPETVSDDQVRSYLMLYRGTGVSSAVAGAALAFLAGRARRGDSRFRLATLGLAFATVVVVGLMAIGAGVAHPIVLLSLLPILVATALITMPSARIWYDREDSRD